MKKRIGIVGSGQVGQTLGSGFLKHDYQVMMGTRNTSKLNKWKEQAGENASIGSFEETAAYGDIIVIEVKATAAKAILQSIGAENLNGKTIIDAANPIADAAPENGVLKFYTTLNKSLMEEFQETFPKANFVKAFNSVGSPFMVNPQFETKPTMIICGNSEEAKKEVTEILDKFGWETADFGKVESARAIEPLCMLWCIPGLLTNEWNHAFKLLKLK